MRIGCATVDPASCLDDRTRTSVRPIKLAISIKRVGAKMNDVDPQAWLADILARIAMYPAHRLNELLPWNWKPRASVMVAAAA